jgi:hypothetical protein
MDAKIRYLRHRYGDPLWTSLNLHRHHPEGNARTCIYCGRSVSVFSCRRPALLLTTPTRETTATSVSGSIFLDEFSEYLGGLLPVMDLTGSVVDIGSHHR